MIGGNGTCIQHMVIARTRYTIAKLKKMKDNKSPGVDGISPDVKISEEISVPLAIVFNLSVHEGIVPLEWKIANVVPILKNGNLCKPENYRSS